MGGSGGEATPKRRSKGMKEGVRQHAKLRAHRVAVQWWTRGRRDGRTDVLYARSRSPISVPANLNSYRLSSTPPPSLVHKNHTPDRLDSAIPRRSVADAGSSPAGMACPVAATPPVRLATARGKSMAHAASRPCGAASAASRRPRLGEKVGGLHAGSAYIPPIPPSPVVGAGPGSARSRRTPRVSVAPSSVQ